MSAPTFTANADRLDAKSIRTDALVVGVQGTDANKEWVQVTPTFLNGALGTGGVKTFRYSVIGKTVCWSLNAQQTAVGTCTGTFFLTLPIPARNSLADVIGSAVVVTAGAQFVGSVRLSTSTSADILVVTGGTVAGPVSVGVAAANLDPKLEAAMLIHASGTYEAL
jgi:hypothetical protein